MTTDVPFKTASGQAELRARKRQLSQRHRTVLLLVDGRRPLAEILSLATQAGASTQHVEDLLGMGLIELPPPPEPPAPVSSAADAAVTSAQWVVPADSAAAGEPAVASSPEAEKSAPVATSQPASAVLATLSAVRSADAPASAPPPVLNQPVILPPVPPHAVAQEPEASEELAPTNGLQQVRDLLTDTLSIDAPLFSARTLWRVRNAQSASELIELVWEIERHFSGKRHHRQELQSLRRARELLGLGNTLVAEESRPNGTP